MFIHVMPSPTMLLLQGYSILIIKLYGKIFFQENSAYTYITPMWHKNELGACISLL